jgi:hypothetical protein
MEIQPIGFTALMPEYRVHFLTLHFLHSLVGRNRSPSMFCVRSLYFAIWNSTKWILLPIFQHSRATISIAENAYEMHVGVFFICKRVKHFDCDRTATQRSHTSLDSVEQEIGRVTALVRVARSSST